MDELAALITMEIYFAKGYKGILKGVYNEDEPWMSDGTIGYLHRRESLEEEGAEPDGMVRLYDEASHVKFVEKILYGEYVFMDSALRDYPYTIQAEYGHGPCWTGNTVQDAYLKNNIYRENGSLRPHGWQGEIIPVRIVGYGKNQMPIAEYAGAWH